MSETIESGDDKLMCEINLSGVSVVRIVQPQKRNAMTLSMWRALYQLFNSVSANPRVRCVILTGDGGHFCAGADVSEFDSNRNNAAAGRKYDLVCDQATLAVRNCRKPVIASISGAAVGGGLSMALACDFRVADKTSRMGIPAGRLGLVYGIVDCSLLIARIGITNAMEVLFTSRIYDANEAVRLGLVDRLVDDDSFIAALNLAEEIAASAPLSIAGHKAILNAISEGTVEKQKDELQAHIDAAFESQDYNEGRRAFAERRAPKFIGA